MTQSKDRGHKGLWKFFTAKGSDLFDDASDARDGAYACALELGHFQLAVEHAADEGCVLVHLERCPLQLQLLHDAHRRIQIQHNASGTDSP